MSRKLGPTEIPHFNRYVEPTKAMADIVINSGMNDVAFDMVKTKIENQMKVL